MYWRKAIILLLLGGLAASLNPHATFAQGTSVRRRTLAPGVLTVIPNQAAEEETFHGPMPLPEFTVDLVSNVNFKWTPNYTSKSDTLLEKAKSVTLRNESWALEFSFKPMRMMYVDIPQASGKMHRKLIWYMLYRVRNTGRHLSPDFGKDTLGEAAHQKIAPSKLNDIRFYPHFVLEGVYRNEEDKYERKAYLDRFIPVAVDAIQRHEKVPGVLHDSISISRKAIELSSDGSDNSVWGVATWEDTDPRIDYFTLYVQGLSNAFRFKDLPPSKEFPRGKRFFQHKTLQLNFWRPGDTRGENNKDVRYGVRLVDNPREQAFILRLYNIDRPLDHRWIYRY